MGNYVETKVMRKYKIKYYTLLLRDSFNPITKPDDVVNELKDELGISENLWVLGLDIKNKVRVKHLVAKGSVNTVYIKPADIFTVLLHNGLSNFIIVHNHPSGDVTASPEDFTFTKKLKEASKIMGINFLDHLIISEDSFYSFKNKTGIL